MTKHVITVSSGWCVHDSGRSNDCKYRNFLCVMKRYHYMIKGYVQGVGFRRRAARIASALNLTGWVRNLPDGRVELEVQGEPENIENLFPNIEQSSYGIEITNIQSTEIQVLPEEYGFDIKYYRF